MSDALKLEVGRHYRSRNGRVVKILDTQVGAYPYYGDDSHAYKANGRFIGSEEHSFDLIEEVDKYGGSIVRGKTQVNIPNGSVTKEELDRIQKSIKIQGGFDKQDQPQALEGGVIGRSIPPSIGEMKMTKEEYDLMYETCVEREENVLNISIPIPEGTTSLSISKTVEINGKPYSLTIELDD